MVTLANDDDDLTDELLEMQFVFAVITGRAGTNAGFLSVSRSIPALKKDKTNAAQREGSTKLY